MKKLTINDNFNLYNNAVYRKQFLKYGPFTECIPDIIAVKHGLKPLAEIYSTSLNEYKKYIPIFKAEGLFVEYLPKQNSEPKNSNTEKKYNSIYNIYISKEREMIQNYKDNSIHLNKYLRGKQFGFPLCCVRELSLIHERFKSDQNIIISKFYSNNLFHGLSNFYISAHYPCDYNCRKTLHYNKNIFEAIIKDDFEFAVLLQKWLTYPLLTWENDKNLDEKICIIFDGLFLENNCVSYSRCWITFTHQIISIPSTFLYFKLGNKILLNKNNIIIFKNNNKIKTIYQKDPFKIFLYNFSN